MSKLTQFIITLSILSNVLTPLQHKANLWLAARPTVQFPRFIGAASFLPCMEEWLATRRKNDTAIATFAAVTDWDLCVPYAGKPSDTGHAPASFRRRVFEALIRTCPRG